MFVIHRSTSCTRFYVTKDDFLGGDVLKHERPVFESGLFTRYFQEGFEELSRGFQKVVLFGSKR